MGKVNGISLFSNVGIGETYFARNGINIVCANEIMPKRALFYQHLYPETKMICGDIKHDPIFNQIIEEYKKHDCSFLIATPPCQGMSPAGKRQEGDTRNQLICRVVDFIKITQPTNVLIENVPRILKTSIQINQKKENAKEYITTSLQALGYTINCKILDACNYNTPQHRKRAIFLISKNKTWEFPTEQKIITVQQAIGSLPSLESGQSSVIKHHNAKRHSSKHILWMKHTPTGKSAFDNKEHFPQKDGRVINGYKTTYKRMQWDAPAPTITMSNGSISSQNNVHPGREIAAGIYSDARALTILELLRLTGLPDDWNIPEWSTETLTRQAIGECLPPLFAEHLIKTMNRSKK